MDLELYFDATNDDFDGEEEYDEDYDDHDSLADILDIEDEDYDIDAWDPHRNNCSCGPIT